MFKLAIVLCIIYLATLILAVVATVLLTILGVKVLKEKMDAKDVAMGILILFFAFCTFLISILLLVPFFI